MTISDERILGRAEGVALVASYFEDRVRDDSTGLVRAAFESALRCLAGGEQTYRAALARLRGEATACKTCHGRGWRFTQRHEEPATEDCPACVSPRAKP